jgi:hypothetical protein
MQMVKTLWPEQLFKLVFLNLLLPLPASHHLQNHSRYSMEPQTLVAMLEVLLLMMLMLIPAMMQMLMQPQQMQMEPQPQLMARAVVQMAAAEMAAAEQVAEMVVAGSRE